MRSGRHPTSSGDRLVSLIERLGSDTYDARYGRRASDFHEIVKTEPPPRQWTIPPYNAIGAHTILAGESGSGKTQLAFQLAVQATQDRPAEFPHDLAMDVRSMHVALVDAEMGAEEYRYRVWDTGLHPYVIPERLKHVDASGLDIVARQDDLDYVMEQIDGYDLVVMDSLKRITPSRVENDNDDMSEAVATITRITRVMPVGIITIHHLGKDGKARGASAIRDACDVLVGWKKHTTRDGEKLRCLDARGEWMKVRMTREPEDRWFRQTDAGLLIPAEAPEKEAPARTQFEQYKDEIRALLPFTGTKRELAESCGTNSHNNTWTDAYRDVAQYNGTAHTARAALAEEPRID
jgi:hypothetical protein